MFLQEKEFFANCILSYYNVKQLIMKFMHKFYKLLIFSNDFNNSRDFPGRRVKSRDCKKSGKSETLDSPHIQ